MAQSEFTKDCIRAIGMLECLRSDESCKDYYARIARPEFEEWGLTLKKTIRSRNDGIKLFTKLNETYES